MVSSERDPARSFELVLYTSSRPTYSAFSMAELAKVHPEMVLCYWRLGLLRALEEEAEGPRFDDDALYLLKRLEQLRRDYGLSLRALRLLSRALRPPEA
ncbi:protein of unknown function [Methylacidimicrobium sp. AP8]|uniref:hypothetical protein n=1 Tax=Methylacidimicrobium sp. AP8 TaxID=2730359 RepID=UPI0018C0A0ED|nr:hypothetical protein [Methylacidimicrobium sp. AP8]CAB4243081.1 protein of unknown function [Methylacidimicrobium sp. AP8]